jgi:asparagine synthetase B (glutamine-hydrolysing)
MINDLAIVITGTSGAPCSIDNKLPRQMRRTKTALGVFFSKSLLTTYESPDLLLAYSGRLWPSKGSQRNRPRRGSNVAAFIAQTYRKSGVAMFYSLEGISLILYDRKKEVVYLWRDWIGTTSVLHSHGKPGIFVAATSKKLFLRFASEATPHRSMAAGYCLRVDCRILTHKMKRLQSVPIVRSRAGFSNTSDKLRRLVQEAIASRTCEGKAALLLSGGADSTILGYVLRETGVRIEAYTVSLDSPQFPVEDSDFDLFAARRAAKWLGIDLHEVKLKPTDVIRTVPAAVWASETARTTLVDEMCGMIYVARRMREDSVTVAYSGEGADSIFGSFLHILRFIPKKDLPSYLHSSVQRSLPESLSIIQRVFHECGNVETIFPYMYLPLVSYSLGLPIEYRVDKSRVMKIAFRRAFAGLIPDEFLWRAKGITRDTTHLRHVLERKLGTSPYRYRETHQKLFCKIV